VCLYDVVWLYEMLWNVRPQSKNIGSAWLSNGTEQKIVCTTIRAHIGFYTCYARTTFPYFYGMQSINVSKNRSTWGGRGG